MAMPEIEKVVGERITYKPVVARVSSHSQYPGNKSFGLEGIDGFWNLHPNVTDLNRNLKSPPPIGTVALWTLTTNPKRGENAKPGSLYRDVIKVEAVPDDAEPVWDGDKEAPEAQAAVAKSEAVSKYDQSEQDRRTSIEMQVIAKADGELIAALAGLKALPSWLKEADVNLIVNRYIGVGQLLAHHDYSPLPAETEEPK